MKYILEKDKKKRSNVFISENLHNSLNFLNKFQKSHSKYLMNKNMIKNKSNFNKISVKNRCIFTNRSKSVYRFCRISRIKFRSYSSFGYLTGVTKSSW